MDKIMKVGDLVIFKGQRKGRLHLEGGYIMSIDGAAAVLACDSDRYVAALDDLELFTNDHMTRKGNVIVAFNRVDEVYSEDECTCGHPSSEHTADDSEPYCINRGCDCDVFVPIAVI